MLAKQRFELPTNNSFSCINFVKDDTTLITLISHSRYEYTVSGIKNGSTISQELVAMGPHDAINFVLENIL